MEQLWQRTGAGSGLLQIRIDDFRGGQSERQLGTRLYREEA